MTWEEEFREFECCRCRNAIYDTIKNKFKRCELGEVLNTKRGYCEYQIRLDGK